MVVWGQVGKHEKKSKRNFHFKVLRNVSFKSTVIADRDVFRTLSNFQDGAFCKTS